jgi:hypothetical protein
VQRGGEGSAATLRRWLHRLGGVGKRAPGVARDDAPARGEQVARIGPTLATRGKRAVGGLADALAIPLLPKGGDQGLPQGETVKVVTPGQNRKHYRAGALELKTGRRGHWVGVRKTNALFRGLLDGLEERSPHARVDTVSVAVDPYGIPKAKAVEQGRAAPPRVALRFLPPSWPQATPSERAFGEVHDTCTRNHQRHRLAELVGAVGHPLATNGPWPYQLSQLYSRAAVTTAVHRLAKEPQLPQAA